MKELNKKFEFEPIMENLATEINNKVRKYYEEYYLDELGLPNYKTLIENRLKEDETYINTVNRIKPLLPFFYQPIDNQKVMIDGAGTGQEFVTFHQLGYDVYGIEPYQKAIDILKLKCQYYNVDENKIAKAYAEDLPFEKNYFDLVWSFTVLEHVQDVKKSIEEIYRVLKPGGWAFLGMPDYKHFYEPHYKLFIPAFLPVPIIRLILKLKGRPNKFAKHGINYINTKKVRNILQDLDFDSMLVHHHWPEEWKKRRSFGMSLVYWTIKLFGNPRDQWWLIRKR